ncbi:MAG: hypothetical protein ACI4E3_07590 [Candidatus Fimousia sp.]|uniref:hypothetical protein n=1 Tax=Anaerostipes sp. 992a TaxID=1261637 RepID=UPI00095184D8|nr:hypothetical protein [Anaerostipes sp. 992a]MDD5969553.1 hypothetical protein [Anaerostipes sp.]OLR58143.1 hypothetical protein BHF69_12935 [Anaerostipes sp. 992a]
MLQKIMEQSFWAFALEAAVLIGVLSKIGILIHYNRLIGESEQMERVHTRWLKSLKKRFDGYGQLNFRVENPENFVDKYMEMDRICGLKSRVFCKIPLVCALIIGLAACQGKEDWIFGTGMNLMMVFFIMELLIDSKAAVPLVRTNLLLSIEKGMINKKKAAVGKPMRQRRRMEEEAAVSREEKLSQEEIEVFGQILKEWWEF